MSRKIKLVSIKSLKGEEGGTRAGHKICMSGKWNEYIFEGGRNLSKRKKGDIERQR